MLYQPVSQWHSLHFELLIELVAQKLTELWRFKNLAYFLTWWPSSMTYLFVNVTYWNCSPIPYVDQVWWWYVKAFMNYAWQNWQTKRQTDRQTDKPTNEHTCQNCKFWQVMIEIRLDTPLWYKEVLISFECPPIMTIGWNWHDFRDGILVIEKIQMDFLAVTNVGIYTKRLPRLLPIISTCKVHV